MKSNKFQWSEELGKYRLAVVVKDTKYLIFFEKESRMADSMVLFNLPWSFGHNAKKPNLLNGMMAWSEFEKILALPEARFANREIERYQSVAVLASGGTLDWTKPEEAYDVPPLGCWVEPEIGVFSS